MTPTPPREAPDPSAGSGAPEASWVDRAIRLVLLAGLLAWSLLVVRPFLETVVWGGILAVALHSPYARLERRLGGRRKTAALLFVLLIFGVLAAPTVLLTETLVSGVARLEGMYQAGELRVGPPPAGVEDWPVVGGRLAEAWSLAHEDLGAALEQWLPQLASLRQAIVGFAKSIAFALLEMVFSIVVMGVFLANAAGADQVVRALGVKIAGQDGDTLVSLARDTTRSVAQGIVGVALIQALLAGLGCFAAGVPAAGLWALLVLVLSVAQISPLLVLGPIAAYLFAGDTSTGVAVAFTVWSVIIALSDNVLKPILLGRGVAVPILVVFLGAIGGLLHAGIVGLFIGPVMLVVTFSLIRDWIERS